MAKETKSGYVIPLVIIGGLVGVAALVGVIFGLIIPSMSTDDTQGGTNPPLIDSSGDDVEVEMTGEEGTGLQVDLSPGVAEPQEAEPLQVPSTITESQTTSTAA